MMELEDDAGYTPERKELYEKLKKLFKESLQIQKKNTRFIIHSIKT